MKLALLALAALPALSLAAPAPWNDGKDPKAPAEHQPTPQHDAEDKHLSGVFKFTSTYVAYAGPDQV
jgi:hypothetical protein